MTRVSSGRASERRRRLSRDLTEDEEEYRQHRGAEKGTSDTGKSMCRDGRKERARAIAVTQYGMEDGKESFFKN